MIQPDIRDAGLKQAAAAEPLRETVSLLRRLIEQRGGRAPERLLDLAVAYSAQREWKSAMDAIEKSIAQFSTEEERAEARYQHGRILFESNSDIDRAVAELRQSTAAQPSNAAAWFYLGYALRTQIDRESSATMRKAFMQYLAGGAPLGREEEIDALLKQLQPRVEGTR